MRIKINVEHGKNVFFISDFHLYHRNVIRFDKRPFLDAEGQPDLEEMHKTLSDNWNAVVRPNDVVFYLGDICLANPKNAKEFVDQLNGEINFVMGNHDRYEDIIKMNRFKTVYDLVDLKIFNPQDKTETEYAICHYPILSWNKANHGTYMIHGHCHGNIHRGDFSTFYEGRRVMDVGCNLLNYTPISYKEIISTFK